MLRNLNDVAVDDAELAGDVRFTPESGHFSALAFMSAYDPKRTQNYPLDTRMPIGVHIIWVC